MISVIIPTYNREKTILRAVNSVLNQTYKDLELIVVDDGSTDNTEKVLSKISDCRFRYIKQKNSGACIARNKGIELSMGEYIAFHDSDDLWHKDKLEKQINILKKIDADIVFCKMAVYKNNKVIKVYPTYLKDGFINPIKNLFEIGTQTIIGKKEVFINNFFDPELPRFQEFEMLYRATKKYSIYCLDEILVDYMVGSDSISHNEKKLYEASKIIMNKHPEIVKEKPKISERIACNLLTSAFACKKQNKNYFKEFKSLAFKYSKSFKVLLKYIYLTISNYVFLR